MSSFTYFITDGSFGIKDLRFVSLISAILLYSIFGSPTPDDPSLIELLIGLLLICAAGPISFTLSLRSAISGKTKLNSMQWSGLLLLVYGLTIPLCLSLAHDNSVKTMIRDLLPFLFMMLPLFMLPLFKERDSYLKYLIAAIIFLGLSFSARVFLPLLNLSQVDFTNIADPFYFANAPTVLFTAVFLMGYACLYVLKPSGIYSMFRFGLLIILAVIPLIAMITITQRATVGWYMLSLFILFLVALYRHPTRLMPIIIGLAVMLYLSMPFLLDLMNSFGTKTQLVGLNMRTQEFTAVVDAVSSSVFHMLFGLGWGGQFSSPAVGGLTVNFTHSLVTAMWLKCGLFGVLLLGLYLYKLFDHFMPQLFRRPILFLALTGPVLIDLFLYASYKSLDFGLILLLMGIYGLKRAERSAGNIANSSPVVATAGSV